MGKSPKTVLFYRDYRGFSGGHLKVWHYFRHFIDCDEFTPKVFFTPESVWKPDNPWNAAREHVVDHWAPQTADILFLGGLDWLALNNYPKIENKLPVINLLQSTRHGDSKNQLSSFLNRPAVRICCSEEVFEAVRQKKNSAEKLFWISNGFDLSDIPTPIAAKEDVVFILGPKNPELALALAGRLGALGIKNRVQTEMLDRSMVLDAMNMARISVLLPTFQEGMYTPPLEAMALGSLVVSPTCQGNRVVCRDMENCRSPAYDLNSVLDAVLFMRSLPEARSRRFIEEGMATLNRHSMDSERTSLFAILRQTGLMLAP